MEHDGLDLNLLRSFSPLDGLKKENLQALSRKAALKELPAGRLLFREGDTDKRTYYLARGQIELRSADAPVAMIKAGSIEARSPLAPGVPRRFTGRAVTDIDYVSIDSDLLDVLITWDQTGSYEVEELSAGGVGASSDDWMTVLLQTKAFHRIPPANLQAIFMRMERVTFKTGDVVIRQGDEGDYFYAVTAGRCAVTRETPLNREGIRLAELGPGDTFGEEALISESKRNATVKMLSDGSLMRLKKGDFNTLLNEPMLQWVNYEEATGLVEGSGAKWLDVRLPSEFESFRLPGAINIPLYFIRLKLKQLDPNLRYIVVCDTGRRSSAAVFILNERGFDAVALRGGLTAVQQSLAAGRR
jgi:CRP-like cAMP-binding protein/rhodanese-related sulfurtransferase